MNIYFTKLNFMLPIGSLFKFLYWFLKYKADISFKLILKMFFIKIKFKKYDKSKQNFNVEWNWRTINEDGTFRVFFDYDSKKIYKIPKHNLNNDKLIISSDTYSNFSKFIVPSTIEIHGVDQFIKEDFFVGYHPKISKKNYLEILNIFIKNRLFKFEIMPKDLFIETAQSDWKLAIKKIEIDCGFNIISGPTHGDLISQNILINKHGEIKLIDWEYAGLGCGFYDIWYYLFDYYDRADPFDEKILEKINIIAKKSNFDMLSNDLVANCKLCFEVWKLRRD
jgi:hypothetical protein